MKGNNVGQETKPMTCADAGRKGGKKCAERYGADFFKTIGKKGGTKTSETHGKEHYERIGKIGGAGMKAKFGREPINETPEAHS